MSKSVILSPIIAYLSQTIVRHLLTITLPGRSMKFCWRDFLSGTLCGAIVMAAGAGIWRRSPHVEDKWVPVQDAQTYDMCLAAGNTTITCDAMMRVLARFDAAEQDRKNNDPGSQSPQH